MAVWVICIFSSCKHHAEPQPVIVSENGNEFLEIKAGRKRIYKVGTPNQIRIINTECHGGDIRNIDGTDTRFQFVYGRIDGHDGEVTKSIYAMLKSGPAEYFVDDFAGGIFHDPPVPLLPATINIGEEWSWTGKFQQVDEETSRLKIVSIEDVVLNDKSVMVVTTSEVFEKSPIQIERSFGKHIGLTRLSVKEKPSGGELQEIVNMQLIFD